MPTLHWLLENVTPNENLQPLQNAITHNNCTWSWINPYYQHPNTDQTKYPPNTPLILHTSLQQATRNQGNWTPGVWCTLPNYDCTKYYTYLTKHLLNNDYHIIPYADIPRQKEFLYNTYGEDNTLFIRPNSGWKHFTGQQLHHETFDTQLHQINITNFPPHTLCIISSPKTITAEYRTLIVDGKLIDACQYKGPHNRPLQTPGAPDDVYEKAQQIANENYHPDPAYIIDIARTPDGQLHLLEFNSFTCSGLYQLNKQKTVQAITQEALKHWKITQ